MGYNKVENILMMDDEDTLHLREGALIPKIIDLGLSEGETILVEYFSVCKYNTFELIDVLSPMRKHPAYIIREHTKL